MHNLHKGVYTFSLGVIFSSVLTAQVPGLVRTSIDTIVGRQGAYAADDGVYTVTIPREEATIVNDWQTLSPNIGLNSWIALKSGIQHEAILTGELLLLQDEVDAVVSKALESGLEVTGLASLSIFNGPRLETLDVDGVGSFQKLASAFRECLREIQRVRRANIRPKSASPEVQLDSAIDPSPLDAILKMNGVINEGVYKATTGTETVLRGEQVGHEMGMNTWVSFAGTNDRAVMHGEMVTTPDELQRVLRALCAKHLSISSVRNHLAGEHPQLVFVHFWGEGRAQNLARAIRNVLDAQVS